MEVYDVLLYDNRYHYLIEAFCYGELKVKVQKAFPGKMILNVKPFPVEDYIQIQKYKKLI